MQKDIMVLMYSIGSGVWIGCCGTTTVLYRYHQHARGICTAGQTPNTMAAIAETE